MMPQPVTPKYLLEGAVYALEQCGLLLRDANLLYRSQSYASAVALAAFAREELGRWRILLALRKEVFGGTILTIEQIEDRCGDHVQKQSAGMLSLTTRTNLNSELGKLLTSKFDATPGSEEWKAFDAQIEKVNRQVAKRIPDDRQRRRMSALYVDPVPPDRWNRPTEITQSIAAEFLQEAATDYSIQYWQHYTKPEYIKLDNPELFDAMTQWSDRPELPRPEHPSQ